MSNPESTTPIPLLLSEQLDPVWLEERASEIAGWSESPHKRWIMASNNLDWAIAEGSQCRMDASFASLHELTSETDYNIELVPYRGAKMIVACEKAFRQRIERNPLSRRAMNTVYRNWAAAGQEISTAEFAREPGRPLASLSEIIFLGIHMRSKDSLNFPFPALPREEGFEGATFVNHDGYLLSRGRDDTLTKKAYGIVSNSGNRSGMHEEVKEVPVLEVISGTLKHSPETVRSYHHLKNHMAVKLAQLRLVTSLLEKDADSQLGGIDLHLLNCIDSGLRALLNDKPYRSGSPRNRPIESEMARQLREKFGTVTAD